MAEEEKNDQAEEEVQPDEAAAEETAPEAAEAQAAEESAPPAAEPEPDPDEGLSSKERRRMQRSRRARPARPERSGEERHAERAKERKKLAEQRRTRREKAKSATSRAKGEGTPPVAGHSNQPKVRQGIVVSNGADKTITVRVDIASRHRVYEKIVRQGRSLHAHDERNEAAVGDVVRLIEVRPMSKTKRWRLETVLEKAR